MTNHLRTILTCCGVMLGALAVAMNVLAAAPNAPTFQEVTPESRAALDRGLEWLAKNQGPGGNWGSNDLGLVSLGALAFLADGHLPGKGPYGDVVAKALDYVVTNARPTGLLNISNPQRDMYNHGLSTFVLAQAYGTSPDQRLGPTLDRALKLIIAVQCDDGGWDYRARRIARGHDLSLVVMQAKAMRSATDSGFDIPPTAIEQAIRSVRRHYHAEADPRAQLDDEAMKQVRGQFSYTGSGSGATLAMAACGVVCLQEFGQYDDWRIPKNISVILEAVKQIKPQPRTGELPLDAYTLYYVGQAIYQVGNPAWSEAFPTLRDTLVANQIDDPKKPDRHGSWLDVGRVPGKPDQKVSRVGGKAGQLYGTAVGCFVLAIPNRYLPILQEGRTEASP